MSHWRTPTKGRPSSHLLDPLDKSYNNEHLCRGQGDDSGFMQTAVQILPSGVTSYEPREGSHTPSFLYLDGEPSHTATGREHPGANLLWYHRKPRCRDDPAVSSRGRGALLEEDLTGSPHTRGSRGRSTLLPRSTSQVYRQRPLRGPSAQD